MSELIQEFKKIASIHKERLAVQKGQKSISYAQLDKESDALACEIIEREEDISPESKSRSIALLLNHDANAIVGMIAGLKVKKAYVPLDPSYPAERLGYCLKDSEARILVTTSDNLELAYKLIHAADTDVTIINIETCLEPNIDKNTISESEKDTAYILYTSGSTGRPKGVIQDKRAISTVASYLCKEFDVNQNDNLLLTTSYSHTVAVLDIFSTLKGGGTIHMYDLHTDFVKQEFFNYIKSERISIIHTVPTFFRYLLQEEVEKDIFNSVRLIMLGGEKINEGDFLLYKKYFNNNCFFANLYGQSEALLGTINILNKSSDASDAVSLGYPIDILKAHILTEGREAGVMNIGEIHFKADWLTGRYHNLPEENGRLYIDDTINQQGQLLKTGDLGRWLPDGSVEYMGRLDHQHKINGNRVDLNEIEKVIEEIEGVNKCVLVLSGKDNPVLGSYMMQEYPISSNEIKRNLRNKLPEYMVPSIYMAITEFPVLPNGKIDRKALLQIDDNVGEVKEREPSDEVINELTSLWKEVLNNDTITPNDNFFQLGGNSLHATEIVNKVYLKYQIEFELSIIFDNQSVVEFAKTLELQLSNKEYV